jgi:hypothetical protein
LQGVRGIVAECVCCSRPLWREALQPRTAWAQTLTGRAIHKYHRQDYIMSNTDKVIKVAPQTRKKGFAQGWLRDGEHLPNDARIQARILAAATENALAHLDTTGREIVETVLASYARLEAGEKSEPADFTLSGHEILEIDRLPDSATLRYVVYRYRYNKFPQLHRRDAFPPSVQIEPTSICNYRCVMCYQADKSFSRKSEGFMGHMSLDRFRAAVDEIDGHVEAVTLASRGEPTLNPALGDMLRYSEGRFLGLKLNTNASMLNERTAHTLLSSDLQTLVFSIDAAEPRLYEKIRVNGNFDTVRRNIEAFSELKAREYGDSPLIIRISGVRLNDQQSIEGMERFWGSHADMVAFTNYNPWQSSYDNPENDITDPCSELWRRMFLWWDGKVNPCDYDYKSHLSKWAFPERSLSDIWLSDFYEELRADHLAARRSEREPCRRCIVT